MFPIYLVETIAAEQRAEIDKMARNAATHHVLETRLETRIVRRECIKAFLFRQRTGGARAPKRVELAVTPS